MNRRHVLVVEDSPADARLVGEMLRSGGDGGFEVEEAATLAEASARLGAERFDVLVIDPGLPDSQGLETFTRLQALVPRTAVLVPSGNDDVENAVRAVESGAQD